MRKKKRTVTTKASSRAHEPHDATKYELVSLKKILLPKSDDEIDARVVAGIAESILVHDLLHPIAVRRITDKRKDGTTTKKTVLVAGFHRHAAMKLLERKEIACFYIDGDETAAELVRLGEDLWRKTLTILRRAEKLVAYYNLASAKVNVSGQVVRKSKFGRPPGGVALAARELPVVGRTPEARRKIIDRAIQIDQIAPEAKEAAIDARLDNNQRALLKIAKSKGLAAQLKKVAELAEISKTLNSRSKRAAKQSAPADQVSDGEVVDSPSLQPDTTQSATDTESPADEETDPSQPPPRVTTLEEMVALWDAECRDAWAYLRFRDRDRFFETLRRTRCKAHVDIVEFIQKAFRGRPMIRRRNLFGLAAAHGLAASKVRKALYELGYRKEFKGRNGKTKWSAVNPNRHWKEQYPVISDAELIAAGNAQPDPADTMVERRGLKTAEEKARSDKYYDS